MMLTSVGALHWWSFEVGIFWMAYAYPIPYHVMSPRAQSRSHYISPSLEAFKPSFHFQNQNFINYCPEIVSIHI